MDELPERPDLCIVLGGDGSILYALRLFAGKGMPVFGINFGTVGFLAAVEREQAEEGLRRAFAGDFEALGLPGLEMDAGEGPRLGLNDVSFSGLPHGRVAELSYGIAGEEVGHVRCDGLVAATPTGSTGYNLANNGPDPRLGGGRLRGQLHRAALADGAGPGRRPGGRAPGRQRDRARGGRDRS